MDALSLSTGMEMDLGNVILTILIHTHLKKATAQDRILLVEFSRVQDVLLKRLLSDMSKDLPYLCGFLTFCFCDKAVFWTMLCFVSI